MRTLGVPNEPESNKVVCDEFMVIFARLFETEDQNDELLTPIGCLHELIVLEFGQHIPMWVVFSENEVSKGSTSGRNTH